MENIHFCFEFVQKCTMTTIIFWAEIEPQTRKGLIIFTKLAFVCLGKTLFESKFKLESETVAFVVGGGFYTHI